MKHRRAVRQELEQRLRVRQPELEQLWEAFRQDARAAGARLDLIERLERRMTWAIWGIATYEAMQLADELREEQIDSPMAPPWICQTCKSRVLRVVPKDDDDMPATA